jgi:hypothetical protein
MFTTPLKKKRKTIEVAENKKRKKSRQPRWNDNTDNLSPSENNKGSASHCIETQAASNRLVDLCTYYELCVCVCVLCVCVCVCLCVCVCVCVCVYFSYSVYETYAGTERSIFITYPTRRILANIYILVLPHRRLHATGRRFTMQGV